MKSKIISLLQSIMEEESLKSSSILAEAIDYDDTDRYWDRSPVDMSDHPNQIKKDKMIANMEASIKKSQENLNNWLEKASQDPNLSTIAINTQRIKYQTRINKKIRELETLKKTPFLDHKFD